MAITPLPSPPLITDAPDVFDTKASAHVASLSNFVTEMNAAIAAVNMTKWISGTTYAIGDVTWSPITFYAYRRKTAGAGTTDPSDDATNWISIASAAAGANADITSMSGLTTISTTGGVSIKGTNTNNDAALGNIGEYVESVIPQTSAVPLTTGTNTNITSISLTAGDWDVFGNVSFRSNTNTSIILLIGGASLTSGTLPFQTDRVASATSGQVPGIADISLSLPIVRFKLAVTKTIYLVVLSSFSTDTLTGYGRISARRVR